MITSIFCFVYCKQIKLSSKKSSLNFADMQSFCCEKCNLWTGFEVPDRINFAMSESQYMPYYV